ncbi:RNA-directed DNA polymerase, eukaryota [Tanacetum coccineum]
MGIGIDWKEVENVTRLIGCSTFSTPFRYLGVKVGDVMSKIKSWDEVTSKLSSRLSKWNTLSIDGRFNLLNRSLLQFLFITCLFSKFLLVFLTRWNLSVETSLIELMERYGKWLGSVGIRFIKAIHSENDYLDELSLLVVGNGEDTKFWKDTWLNEVALKVQFPIFYDLESQKDISVADKKRDTTLALSFRRSRRRVRNYIDDILLPKEPVQTRWVKVMPIKVIFLDLRVWLDDLPTRFNLSSRGLEIHSLSCTLCNVSVESTSHIFFSRSLARQLFNKVFCWWDIDALDFLSYDEWLTWLKNIRMPKGLKDIFEGVC